MRYRTLSQKNAYYIPKHTFMIVYHYCLNYPDWKRQYADSVGLKSPGGGGGGGIGDPTASQAIAVADLGEKIHMIEETAMQTEPSIYKYLLRGVTEEGMTFDQLKAQGMPCERKMYYDRRRKFYYALAAKLKL